MSNILKGIQLNEVSPHDYDSDWDYQDALARSGRPRSSYRSQEDDTFDSDVAYSRKVYQATKAAKEKAQRDADHNRLASGTNESKINEVSFLQIGDVTDKILAAVKAAKQHNGKVVKTAGGYFKITTLDDPRPAIEANPEYYSKLKKYQDELKTVTDAINKIDIQFNTERPKIFHELYKRFPDTKGRSLRIGEESTKWFRNAMNNLDQKYYGTDKYKALVAQKKNLDVMLKTLRDTGVKYQEQLDELSPETLASYKKKAGAAATQADKQGDYKLGNKRFSGIVKATKKQFAQDEKNLKEFAADDGDGDGGEEDTLRKYAKLWYNGNLGTQQQVEQILDRMGWEIGELESEEGGAFVVQAGDENGDSYIGFTANDLTDNLDENLHKWFKEKWVRFGPDGKIRGACARGDDSEGKPKCLPQAKAHALGKKGRASAAARKRREDPNPERSGKAINVNTKKKSNESLDNPWGDQGNFAGDTPVNLGGVAVKNLGIGDIVSYLGQKAKILDMSKTGNTSRIVIPSSMGSITKDVLTKDLKRTSLSEEELDEACWKGYHKEGNKKMFGKTYPNCVKNEGVAEGSLNEFAVDPSNGGDDDEYDLLFKLVKMWWLGNEQQHFKAEKTLASMGISIEENEPDIILHRGNQFLKFPMDDFEQGVAEADHSESCPHCGGEMVSEELMNEKKDACYYKVKSRYKVWPSAYASGALVKCRKKGASNWGNGGKSNESIEEDDSHDVEQRMIAKIAKYKEYLAHLKKTDPEAYKREIEKSKTSGKVPPVSTFEEQGVAEDQLDEKWSKKYKDSINCSNPKGFSQKAHCAGKKKNESAIMKGLKK